MRVRQCLDSNRHFTGDIDVNDMAAALIMFFYELPSSLIPKSVYDTYKASPFSGKSAVSFARDAMNAVEFGVFDTALELFKSVLLPEYTKINLITEYEISSLLADIFFHSLDIENCN